ncbi:MAG: DUF4097 family beta strand repeat protein [Clostridia bacterium]|nr:DUF4097 family beta strand repeat protein [Clostridia bacterium]
MIVKHVTNTYEITDTYKNINILDIVDADITIEPSSDDRTRLVFFEHKKHPYEFFIEGDTLTIKLAKARRYNFLRIGFRRSKIRLYVPKSNLETISAKSNVGRVDISSIICNGVIDIQTNAGKINLENVACQAFNSKGNSGAISVNNLTVKESISIKRNAGKVLLNDCSAREIFVKTNTGSVCGKLPSNMAFIARTNTAKMEIPQATIGEPIGGRCEIKTNTGNIKFE